MKKAIIFIVIESAAVIALLWAIFGITHIITHGYQPVADFDDIVRNIGAIVTIPISILVIFNIKLPRALSIPLAVVSILMALSYLAIFRLLFLPDNSFPISWTLHILIWIILIIFYVPPIITFATYAIRALRPARQSAKTEEK